jgi:hypothetical protein
VLGLLWAHGQEEKTFTNVRIVSNHAGNNDFFKSEFLESFFHMMILISKQKLF